MVYFILFYFNCAGLGWAAGEYTLIAGTGNTVERQNGTDMFQLPAGSYLIVPTTTGIKLKEDVLKYASSTGTGETVPLTMQSPTGEVQFTGECTIVLFLAGLLQTTHVFCRCMAFLLGIMYAVLALISWLFAVFIRSSYLGPPFILCINLCNVLLRNVFTCTAHLLHQNAWCARTPKCSTASTCTAAATCAAPR
jgi:hypothetical protein